MPTAFLVALKHLTDSATATLGIKTSLTDRSAYWLDGHSLGVLSCSGATDEDANIEGRVIRLDSLVSVDLEVKVAEYDKFTDSTDSTEPPGRVLTVKSAHGEPIKFDATPRSAGADRLKATESFIDAVLAALARP
jgi:hypothetical protein